MRWGGYLYYRDSAGPQNAVSFPDNIGTLVTSSGKLLSCQSMSMRCWSFLILQGLACSPLTTNLNVA